MLIKFSTSNPQSLRDSSLERELLTIAFTLENISTNRNLLLRHRQQHARGEHIALDTDFKSAALKLAQIPCN